MILDKRADLGHGDVKKLLFSLSVPTITSQIVNMLYNLVDRVFIGHMQPAETVGKLALTGVGVCLPIIMVISAFASLMAIGGAPRASIAEGAGESEKSERIMGNCLTMLVITALVLTVLFESFAEPLLLMFGASENTIGYALDYMRIYALGTIFVQLTLGMNAYITAQGFATVSMKTVLIGALLNIALDPLFIFVFGLGVRGAALATVLSQMISAVLPIVVLLRQKEDRLELRKLRIERSLLGRILRIGIPAGLQFVTFDFSNVLIQSGINSFGDTTMAAWTAYGKTDALVWMISGAFGVSITTFVGQNFGAQKYSRIRQGAWTCLALSIAMVGALNVTLLLFRSQILGIYTDNPEVIAVGSMVMLSIMPYEFLFMPIEVFAGTMRGVGNSLMPTLITGSCVCLFRVVWLMTAVRHWHSLKTLTLSYPLSWALAAAVFLVVYFKGSWLRRRR